MDTQKETDMFPLEADNGVGEKALSYYERVLEQHGDLPSKARRRETARELLLARFPWVAQVFEATKDKEHPHHKAALRFRQAMGAASRRVPLHANEQQETAVEGQDEPESDSVAGEIVEPEGDETVGVINETPSPTAAMREWFQEHDQLQATFKELAHFTGRHVGVFKGARKRLSNEGYTFGDNDANWLTVLERPGDQRRKEIQSELQALMERADALKKELEGL